MSQNNLKILNEMLEVQGRSGNWNCDPYMHGMYNGMEFFLSILENREPNYREAPEEWLCDRPHEFKLASTEGDNQ